MNLIDLILFFSTLTSGIFFIISFNNLLKATNLKKISTSFNKPVSVLIPARNEELNIENCIDNVFNSSYKNLEVIVLNDNSIDKTLEILTKLQIKYKKLKVINGKPLAKGWLGKNWACHQLSQEATSEYFLFIDADVTLKKEAIESLMALIDVKHYSAISVFSTQITKTFGEKITIPLINFVLLTLLPLSFSNRSKSSKFSASNGQVFLFKKDDYLKIDGHNGVKDKVVEDVALAKNLRKLGLTTFTLLGGELIYCRMYNNFFGGFKVLSKILFNIFFGFWGSLLFIFLFIIAYILPFILVFLRIDFLSIIILNILSLAFVLKKSQKSLLNIFNIIFLYIILITASLNSIYVNLFNKINWKGRKI